MKTGIKIVGIAVALLIVIAIALPFLINVNSFRPQIESNLSSALGRAVKVGNLSLSIFSGSVEADHREHRTGDERCERPGGNLHQGDERSHRQGSR